MLREVDKIFFTVNNNVSGLAVKFNLHDHVSDRFKTNIEQCSNDKGVNLGWPSNWQ